MRSNFNFYNMKTIVLISCAKEKKKVLGKVRAKDLYISPLFKKSLTYAKQLTTTENIYILSDKYYLLSLDEEVEFYDVLLKDKTDWGEKIVEQLREIADLQKDRIIILAGENYITPIRDSLANVELPLKGLRQGERTKYLKEAIEKNKKKIPNIIVIQSSRNL